MRAHRLAGAAALVLLAGPARAGGLARPNLISARGVGIGGAFTGIADDPTAWYFNPAGAAWADDAVSLGGELIVAPRSYTPIDASGAKGPEQKANAAAPVPALGLVFHPRNDGVPSRLAFGAGIWNTFGGALSYDKMADPNVPAVNSSTDLVIELAAGVAYEVDDVFAIGGAVRMGLGVFAVNANAHPVDSDLSAVGVGVGATLGVMVRPSKRVQIGLTWRSGMDVTTQGSGTATLSRPMESVNVEHQQHWPQQGSFGVSLWPTRSLRVAGQLDWTQWSRYEDLVISFPDAPANTQTFDLDWKSTWTARGGLEYVLGTGAVRAGAYYDTNAVPDRTIERPYLDDNKIGVSAGGSARFGEWRVDAALDYTLPGTRTVRDNKAEYAGTNWTQLVNIAPGEHTGYVVTFELAVARLL
jgi:long-chain fatty acid transport protein